MLGGLRLPELLILLAIVLLFFGAKRLPEMGASMGKSIKAFKKGMNEPVENEETSVEETPVEETKAIETKRQELDALEREIAAKKAQAAAYEAQQETHNV